MTHPMTRTLLAISGGIGLTIGLAILFQPHAFHASSGISLGSDPSLMSEIRAPGGLLILSSLMALAGAVKQTLAPVGLALSAAVYGSYGLSRLVSLILDGIPTNSLVLAALIELLIGAASLLILYRRSRIQGETS